MTSHRFVVQQVPAPFVRRILDDNNYVTDIRTIGYGGGQPIGVNRQLFYFVQNSRINVPPAKSGAQPNDNWSFDVYSMVAGVQNSQQRLPFGLNPFYNDRQYRLVKQKFFFSFT
jgi:hypothetical protein